MPSLVYLALIICGVCTDKTVALTDLVCERETLTIDCGTDVIHIIDASYGRTDGVTCPHAKMDDQACNAASSMGVMTLACDGISSCSVLAKNSVFGDPCTGTFKYLEVEYECVTPPEPVPDMVEMGCFNGNIENDPVATLECLDHRLDDSYQDRDDAIEKCAQAAAARGWTTFSLLDGGACHSDADACQNHDNYGETTGCGATGTSSKHTVYEIIQSGLACEDQSLHLECDCGFIHVLSANYGRDDGVTCGGPVQATSCSATNSLSIVSAECDMKTSCDVDASNGVFGDPCVGTFKYLEVEFHCNILPGELQLPTTAITCEADGPMMLNCFGMTINIISANFGRTEDASTCPHNAVSDQACYAASSLSVVQDACQGENSCSVAVSSGNFGGDPCPGTYKYLEVEYNCA